MRREKRQRTDIKILATESFDTAQAWPTCQIVFGHVGQQFIDSIAHINVGAARNHDPLAGVCFLTDLDAVVPLIRKDGKRVAELGTRSSTIAPALQLD